VQATQREEVGVRPPLRTGARKLGLVLSAALGLSVISVSAVTPASAGATVQPGAYREPFARVAPAPNPVRLAGTALQQAIQQESQGQLSEAMTSLRTVRVNLRLAHTAAMAQIGKPPSDPESDDPPGPPAVLSVLGLEHRVGMGVVPLFNGNQAATFVHALRYTLRVTHTTRDTMLKRVTGLPPEGAGSDYTDDMSDTLGTYTGEVNLITTALSKYQLTPSGRTGLVNALAQVRATRVVVNKAYGGGE
jgi:hypothetical protein